MEFRQKSTRIRSLWHAMGRGQYALYNEYAMVRSPGRTGSLGGEFMDIRNFASLREKAEEDYRAAAFPPARLVLLHSGIAAAASLLCAVLNLLIQGMMDAATGLGGLGSRTVLGTVQTLLNYALPIALPFWEFGLVFAVIGLARRRETTPGALTMGFRNFGPVLRYQLLNGLIYIGVIMVLMHPLLGILMLTPLSRGLPEALANLANSGITDTEAIIGDPQVLQAIRPLVMAMLLLLAAVLVPLFYRLRMGSFALADDPQAGAMAAIRKSLRLTRGNSFALLRVDLHFWWYYLGMLASAAVCYGETLLALLGVRLPLSAQVQYILFYALGLGVQLLIQYAALARVQLTYAAAYDALASAPRPPARAAAVQWEY